ncbi:hypothetical protein [Chromobacterium subtsugae]|uniref:hypothetical protein n=1 Tax=Chromobacterium subtsugae TaxID=251747 RepID=UPI000640E189|nr:hypothetical protein [Chromobacterium subtsugae]
MRLSAESVLRTLADHVRSFIKIGPELAGTNETQEKQGQILLLATELENLANNAAEGHAISYRQFETVLQQLHKLGFFPEARLVSQIAQALVSSGAFDDGQHLS